MTAAKLLVRLKRASIVLTAVGDQLKVSAPKGAITETIRATISENKAALLDLLNRSVETPLRPVTRSAPLPVSHFQRRLWVLTQFQDEDDVTHNLVVLWPIDETADPDLIVAAVGDLARRHEILRSVYIELDGEPRAALLAPEATMVERADISARSIEEQKADLERSITAEVLHRFDLARDVPFRWTLIDRGDGFSLMVTAHHIAIDQWSFALLRNELRRSIEAVRDRRPLPPAPLQYADFADWQQRSADGVLAAEDLDWWQEKMKGAPQLSLFPTDKNTPGRPEGSSFTFRWDRELTRRIRELAQRERATTYMVLLAACAVVLSLYSRQRDLVLGSSLGAREHPDFEAMIGPFVDLLVMRLDLEDDPSLGMLIARARDAVLDAHAHRSAPFEAVVEYLSPPRSLDHAPLFQVAVVMHNATTGPVFPIYSGGVQQHLTWFAREDRGELAMAFEYRSDRYENATMQRIAAQFEAVVRRMIVDPECKASKVPLLTADERHLLLHHFNRTQTDFDDAPFIVRFERLAIEHPDRLAIRCGDETVTLGELDSRASEMASVLARHGVARGNCIGICMSRAPLVVAALLAVQKIGAVYLPLDPEFPPERLSFMVADSGADLVLSDEQALDAASVIRGADILDVSAFPVDSHWPHPAAAQASDAVYVNYTSGSTGRPNGVIVSHRALSNFLSSMAREPGLSEGDVLAAVTTISFDIAGLELYLPLLSGAVIELVPREIVTDGEALAALLVDRGVTAMQATPATWRLLLAAGWDPSPRFAAMCGGEALTPDLANSLAQRVHVLWNLYGPTETTIWSTVARIDDAEAAITVGKPIANTQIYIVDADGEPTVTGIAGEILIGGIGLAIGYHERPQLTEQRFIPDRFSRTAGARLYRTGDIGRWTSTGEIIHMGRLDHQVKVRGYRIEPQEIEAVLDRHPAVRQAAVIATDIAPETAGLVAYCVLETGVDLTTSDARAHLRASLPAYMIPAVIVMLETMPLTPNGKIDRKALPHPFGAVQLKRGDFIQPAPGIERDMAEIWQELLAIEKVSASDNFFELGGHSLLALRMVSLMYQRTGLRVPARMLFTQTLSQVAGAVEREFVGEVAAQ